MDVLNCDERRPECGNCERYGCKCGFLSPDSPTLPKVDCHQYATDGTATFEDALDKERLAFIKWPQDQDLVICSSVSRETPSFISMESLSVSNGFDNFHQLPLPTMPNISYRDLEIFHHYATYTSASLSDRDSVQSTWRVAVTKEALPHEFLMHALLSFASAHLTQICPAQREMYGQSAINHRTLALRGCMPILRNITPINCHALFAFSSITAISTFAYPDTSSSASICAIDNILTFTTLIRGVHVVLQGSLDWIRSGSLEPILQIGRLNWADSIGPLPAEVCAAFERLHALNETFILDCRVQEVYKRAIQDLERSFGAYPLIATDRSLVFLWCAIIPEEYVNRAKNREPMALVILAHFAVLLHSVGAQWWAGDRGKRLAEAIECELNDEWKPAVQWPMNAIQGAWAP